MPFQKRRSRISSRTPTKMIESCPTIMNFTLLSVIFLWHLFVRTSAAESLTLGFISPSNNYKRRSKTSYFLGRRDQRRRHNIGLSRLLSSLNYNPYLTFSNNSGHQIERSQEWIDNSIRYYSTLRRISTERLENIQRDAAGTFFDLASDHYFALTEIRGGKLNHAEQIYESAIAQIKEVDNDIGHCDHEALAASTLLLALLKQRMKDTKGARSVFLNFFRIISQDEVDSCSCSAKVLQAYALFELRNGFSLKSVKLIEKAVSLDENLSSVLKWKQFSDLKGKYGHYLKIRPQLQRIC